MFDPSIDITSQLYYGLAAGFVIGIFFGFMLAKQLGAKEVERRITALQLLSLAAFFVYMVLTFMFGSEPNVLISMIIFAFGSGASIGNILEKYIEGRIK